MFSSNLTCSVLSIVWKFHFNSSTQRYNILKPIQKQKTTKVHQKKWLTLVEACVLGKSKDLSHEMRRIFHQTEEQRMNLSLTATVSLNACLDVGITSRLTLIILLLMFMIGLNKPSCRKMAGNEKENKNKNEAQITNSKPNGHWNVNTWGSLSDLLAHSCLISMLING